jgi:arabinogalactan oligomer/maltooligosaccharide transport system permease protein
MTGYVFSRFRFKGKKPILISFLLLQMFPSFMGIIALFMIFRTFGWLNKPLYLVFIYAAGAIPYNTYLIRGYMRSIPMAVDEAATIDGASKTAVFFKIILPLSTPIIGFLAVNAFMAPWMDYMLPFQLLNMQNQTVAIFLYRLTDPLITVYYNPLNFMAGALVLATPITLVQFYMQRYIVYGMAAGADKG